MKKNKDTVFLAGISALILFSGCDFGNNPDKETFTMSNKVIVASTAAIEYTGGGNVGLYSVENNVTSKNLLPIHSDNSIRIFDTTVYLLERYGMNNVLMVKGYNISSGTVDNQINITDGDNIHDVVFVNETKAYITVYEGQHLIGYNPQTGDANGKRISLAHLSPSGATTPKMSEAINYNGTVYIGLQKYADDLISGILDTGTLAVINSANDSVEKEIVLKKFNPHGMYIYNKKLYCACLGRYGQLDGGIVAVDLTTKKLIGTVIDENELGNDVSDVLIISDSKGFAIVSDNSFTNFLVAFNPSNGKKIANVDAGGIPSDFLLDDGKLYVASRDPAQHGIVVIDAQTNEKLSGPHNVGLPPLKIAMLKFGE